MAKRDRIFAGFGAALFLITSSAVTIAVIISLTQSSSSSPTSATTKTTSSSSANKKSTSSSQSVPTVGSKLAGFTPITKPVAKLEIQNIKVGTGTVVKPGATVTADYVGALAKTGVVFGTSASSGGPQTFSLKQVIEGWQLGIPGMKVGGTRALLIPAALGYGSHANNGIPANSDLFFEVTIVKVVNP